MARRQTRVLEVEILCPIARHAEPLLNSPRALIADDGDRDDLL